MDYERDGERRLGAASAHLASLTEDAATVRVFIEPNERFRLPDDTPLRIGMSTDVNIVIRVAKNALLLPSIAVEGNSVFVVEGDRASRREIRTGIRGTSGIEVLSGVDETSRIVSPYPADLDDGARVAISGSRKE